MQNKNPFFIHQNKICNKNEKDRCMYESESGEWFWDKEKLASFDIISKSLLKPEILILIF